MVLFYPKFTRRKASSEHVEQHLISDASDTSKLVDVMDRYVVTLKTLDRTERYLSFGAVIARSVYPPQQPRRYSPNFSLSPPFPIPSFPSIPVFLPPLVLPSPPLHSPPAAIGPLETS